MVHSDEHYAKLVQRCANEAGGLPMPPSDRACQQPGNSLTAPLFAEVAEWDANVHNSDLASINDICDVYSCTFMLSSLCLITL